MNQIAIDWIATIVFCFYCYVFKLWKFNFCILLERPQRSLMVKFTSFCSHWVISKRSRRWCWTLKSTNWTKAISQHSMNALKLRNCEPLQAPTQSTTNYIYFFKWNISACSVFFIYRIKCVIINLQSSYILKLFTRYSKKICGFHMKFKMYKSSLWYTKDVYKPFCAHQ